jgi:hypothetical protein
LHITARPLYRPRFGGGYVGGKIDAWRLEALQCADHFGARLCRDGRVQGVAMFYQAMDHEVGWERLGP